MTATLPAPRSARGFPGRRFQLAAALFLLVAACGHGLGHLVFYENVEAFSPDRRAAYEAMQRLVTEEQTGATLWNVLQMFSAAFAVLLLLLAAANFALARSEATPRARRSWSAFSSLTWLAALLLFALRYPVVPALAISGGAFLLHAGAFLRQHAAR